jgi:hypothetical protein
VGSTKFLTRS